MKVHQVTFIFVLVVLVVLASLSFFTLHRTFKFHEALNNEFYTETAFYFVSDYIQSQQQRYTDGLFTLSDIEKVFHTLLESEELRSGDAFSKISHPFDFYYHGMDEQMVRGNMSASMAEAFLLQRRNQSHAQLILAEVDSLWYMGVLIDVVTLSASDSRHDVYVLATRLEKLLNLSTLSHLVDVERMSFVHELPEPSMGMSKDVGNGGLITWGDGDYNRMFVPVHQPSSAPMYVSIPIEKPSIVSMLRVKMLSVLLFMFVVFLALALGIWAVLRRLSGEIEGVIQRIRGIAHGDYRGELTLGKTYEMSVLGESIRHMALTIDDKISALNVRNEEILGVLMEALDAKDAYTKGHSDRVSTIAVEIAERIGFEDKELLMRAALMHDIGKIAVPEAVLNKNGRLTDDEFALIQRHPQTGYDILSRSTVFLDIADIVLSHHERYDGSGYPRGLKGDEIPMAAQILSLADVYDALTSDRPYRKAMSSEAAMLLIKNEMRHHFSPVLLGTEE